MLRPRPRPPDPAVFEQLYDATAPRAFELAQLIVPDPETAEDALRAAYLDLWRHPPEQGLDGGHVLVEVLVRVQVAARELAGRGTA